MGKWVFFGSGKEWYHFQKEAMVGKMVNFFYHRLIINSMPAFNLHEC